MSHHKSLEPGEWITLSYDWDAYKTIEDLAAMTNKRIKIPYQKPIMFLEKIYPKETDQWEVANNYYFLCKILFEGKVCYAWLDKKLEEQ